MRMMQHALKTMPYDAVAAPATRTSPSKSQPSPPPPPQYVCPISKKVMRDPVFAADCTVYDRESIELRFADGDATSPATGQRLQSLPLRPNAVLKRLIDEWRERQDAFHGDDDNDASRS